MPRGVYNRSKTPTEKSTQKTEKKARAPYGSKKAAKAAAAIPKAATEFSSYSLIDLASLRACFTGNRANNAITDKIDILINRGLDVLVGGTQGEGPVTFKTEKRAEAPVQQAPAPIQATAPFNPPVPPNGQA